MPQPAPDAPYDQLATLPRTLWLPALVSHTGADALADSSARRLADVQRWRSALAQGDLPPADAHFGDAQACAALRSVVGQLQLPAAARNADAMGEQILRSVLWHLDRLIDLQPALGRPAAIRQIGQEFCAAWQRLQADWDAVASAGREEKAEATIDLEARTVTVHAADGKVLTVRFEVPEDQRNRLLKGLDAIAETLQFEADLQASEARTPIWVVPQMG